MTTQLSVTPRRPGDPEVDHTPVLLVHRAMLADAARFAVLLTDLAALGAPIETRGGYRRRERLIFAHGPSPRIEIGIF